MKKIIISLIIFLALGICLHAQKYKVIVNSANTTSSISKVELAKYFLLKTKKWANGEKVQPIDQSSKSAVRTDFSNSILEKSVSAVKGYWQQYLFAGRGTPPIEKPNDNEVVEFVRSTPGSIGYVSASANVNGVKVIEITE